MSLIVLVENELDSQPIETRACSMTLGCLVGPIVIVVVTDRPMYETKIPLDVEPRAPREVIAAFASDMYGNRCSGPHWPTPSSRLRGVVVATVQTCQEPASPYRSLEIDRRTELPS